MGNIRNLEKLEIDFAFGSKHPTDVSQLVALAVGVSNVKRNLMLL